jgi:hypothetical protein
VGIAKAGKRFLKDGDFRKKWKRLQEGLIEERKKNIYNASEVVVNFS